MLADFKCLEDFYTENITVLSNLTGQAWDQRLNVGM